MSEKELRKKLKTDFPFFSRKCLWVRTKDKAIQKLELNDAQLYIHQRLEDQLERTGKVRALILKGRQQGCSTYVEGRFIWKTIHSIGIRAFILTHLDDATTNLFGMAKRFYDNLPGLVKPPASAANAKELAFNDLDSSYRVGTAGSKSVGRSETIQLFHGSEVAYWPNADEHMAGVVQAVPDALGTEIILESTSCGAVGKFYELCMMAKQGLGDYELVFVPWFIQNEYRKTPPVDFIATEEEKNLALEFGLDSAQIYWRRMKIFELGNDITRFKREYPNTVDEAFATEVPGALWTRELLRRTRVNVAPSMRRIVVAVDPAVSSNDDSDETGIMVTGLGVDGHGYLLEDASGRYKPEQWARKVIQLYEHYKADRVIAEVNNGGEMVEATLRAVDPKVSYKEVHASKGKYARAEPIAALYEQDKIHHVGVFQKCEDQMCAWVPYGDQRSPDRIDASVWGFTELMLKATGVFGSGLLSQKK